MPFSYLLQGGYAQAELAAFLKGMSGDVELYKHDRTGAVALRPVVEADDESYEEGCEPEGYEGTNIWRYWGIVAEKKRL